MHAKRMSSIASNKRISTTGVCRIQVQCLILCIVMIVGTVFHVFVSVCWPFSTFYLKINNEPVHEISNNVVGATSKASDQPAHMRSLIRAFTSRLSIL